MKKDTLFLIIAALTLFIAWRTYKLHKKNNGGKTEPDTEPDNGGGNGGGNGGNGGGNPNPNPGIEPNIDPLDPDNPIEPEPGTNSEELISRTTIEKCPYCGTPGAEVTRIGRSLTSNMFIKTVVCPNKSCPGAVEAKAVFKSKKFETEK